MIRSPRTVKKAIDKGSRHSNFMVSLYRKQLAAGRHLLHEHPATAVSWKEQGMMSLARNPFVHCVVAHQCAYGFSTPDQDGNPAPARKPTRFMTSSTQSTTIYALQPHPQTSTAGEWPMRCSSTLPIGTCACNSSWHEEHNNGRSTLYGQTQ